MNFHRTRIGRAVVGAAAIATVLGLASCGGSGGNDDNNNNNNGGTTTTPGNTPPAAASQSVQGFIAYLETLVPTMPANAEPLDVTGFVAPTDDTMEPTAF